MPDYIKLKTSDNTTVWVRKDQVAAVEEIAGTVRTAGYIKLYIAGYSFNVTAAKEDVFKALDQPDIEGAPSVP